MKHPRLNKSDRKKIDATAVFLQSFFPEASPGHTIILARSLVEAPMGSDAIFHSGVPDQTAPKSFATAVARAKSSSLRFSEWTQTGLETALYQMCVREHLFESIPDFPRPPITIVEIQATLEGLLEAANRAEDMRASWRAPHGKNIPAILLIDEARRVWRGLSDKEPPPRALNVETQFAEFLRGVFECVGVHINLQKAHESWADIYHTPGSPIYERRQE